MDTWLIRFDAAMRKAFEIDHQDAGLSETELVRYRDLPPEEAAFTFGEDYDLDRVDQGWR